METLIYNYGETPESVIRERLDAFDGEREEAFAVAVLDALCQAELESHDTQLCHSPDACECDECVPPEVV